MPPLETADLQLVRLLHASSVATDGSESEVTFGESSYSVLRSPSGQVVTFQYEAPGTEIAAANLARARIDVSRGVELTSISSTTEPEVSDGLTVADLGSLCTPDGSQPAVPLSGYPRQWPCEYRALVYSEDFVAEVSAQSASELQQIVSAIDLGTLDELRDSLGDVPGAAEL
jgi:hypothetical protein